MTNRGLLIQSIAAYKSAYQEELAFKKRFQELLEHPRAFFRDHLPGHITASAWIIDPTRKYALLTHHAKLHRWLQPGGHADGQEDVLAVAQREAWEETRLMSLKLSGDHIFDLDIHLIPARHDFPEHFHYDVRFLLVANIEETFTISEESKDLAWLSEAEVVQRTGSNQSILRMAEKVRDLP
jgi:8-oxo-dGTP pyrophosphatase MutT (NUDIX family)